MALIKDGLKLGAASDSLEAVKQIDAIYSRYVNGKSIAPFTVDQVE